MIRGLFVPFAVKSPHLRSHAPPLPSSGLFVSAAASGDDAPELHAASVQHERLSLRDFIVQHLI